MYNCYESILHPEEAKKIFSQITLINAKEFVVIHLFNGRCSKISGIKIIKIKRREN